MFEINTVDKIRDVLVSDYNGAVCFSATARTAIRRFALSLKEQTAVLSKEDAFMILHVLQTMDATPQVVDATERLQAAINQVG